MIEREEFTPVETGELTLIRAIDVAPQKNSDNGL